MHTGLPFPQTQIRARFLFALLAALVLLFFVPFPTDAEKVFWGPFFNAGHFPLFFVLMLVFTWVFSLRRAPRAAVKALLSCFVLTVLIELLQPAFGRTASLIDLTYGSLGICSAALLVCCWAGRRGRAMVMLGSCLILAVLFYPAWEGLLAAFWRSANYPLIADFEDVRQLRLWKTVQYGRGKLKLVPEAAPQRPEYGKSARVSIKAGLWSGIEYDAGERDWSEYSRIKMDLFIPGNTEETLFFRIDDSREDPSFDERFNSSRSLKPGWNTVEFSTAEIESGGSQGKLNLHRIKRMLVFIGSAPTNTVFYLDNVRLEK